MVFCCPGFSVQTDLSCMVHIWIVGYFRFWSCWIVLPGVRGVHRGWLDRLDPLLSLFFFCWDGV